MNAPHFCPHCGFNLDTDKPIVRGAWRLTPVAVWHKRKLLALTPSEAAVLYAVAAGGGRPVRASTIGERVGIDSENTANLTAVYVSKIRKKLGALSPIGTLRGAGYYWLEAQG